MEKLLTVLEIWEGFNFVVVEFELLKFSHVFEHVFQFISDLYVGIKS